MLQFQNHRLSSSETGSLCDIRRIRTALCKRDDEAVCLAMDLTADADSAETCLILAMRDCFFKIMALQSIPSIPGRRRMVIRNAIAWF